MIDRGESLAGSCTQRQSLVGDAGAALLRAHSLWLHRGSLQHVVCSCCSRTQGSCSLVLLLDMLLLPLLVPLPSKKAISIKSLMSRDSAYGAGLFWSGALSQCFPVSFLLTSSIFLGNISCSSQCRVYYQTLITAPFSLCGCPAQCPRVIWRG